MASGRHVVVVTSILLALMLLPTAEVFDFGEAGRSSEDRLIDGYRTFSEIEAQLRSLAENHSDISVLYDLGELYPNDNGSTKTSLEGRHFWALKISDDPRTNDTDEPDILYVGMHHAREWMTTEMMMWLIEHILADYGTNATITEIVDGRELWMFPVLNPDGFVWSETERSWRKNRRDNGDGTFGVDPNRNYGYEWGCDDTGSSPDTSDPTYRGPYPFSEPCTQIMRDFAYDVGFKTAISFHTYSEVMIWPPAYTRQHAEHYLFFKELARRMALHNGYDYGDVADGTLYLVNGGWDDFMYYNTSCLSFTYEMNSAEQGGFYADASYIEPTCSMNYEAALELAKAPVNLYDLFRGGVDGYVMDPRGNPLDNVSVNVTLIAGDALNLTTGPDGRFSFHAPDGWFYRITAEKEGYSTFNETVHVSLRDRLTRVNVTIHDNVPPVISRVVASHDGEAGAEFGIGQEVRIDVYEELNETNLEGVVTIQSIPAQYFLRRQQLAYDGSNGSYYFLWDTSGLKVSDSYTVATELWDVDQNKDGDGASPEGPDLTLSLRDITPPDVPANLSVEAPPEGKTLMLTWEGATDDTVSYTLQRMVGLGGEWSFLIDLDRKTTSFTDQGLENGLAYSYRIMAWDAVPLPSPWSATVTGIPLDLVPPGQVDGLHTNAPPVGGIVEISWTESTDDTAVYILYRDSGAGFEEAGRFPRGVTEYIDTGLDNDRTYRYRVSAMDASGNEGPLSTVVQDIPRDVTSPAMPRLDPLPELTNLSSQPVSGTAEPGCTVVIVVNQEEGARLEASDDGTFSGTIALISGMNRVTAMCFDPSQNPSGETEPVIVQADFSAPRVVFTTPEEGEVDVPVVVKVTLGFSEALMEPSVSVRLVAVATGSRVLTTVEYYPTTKTLEVLPVSQLEKGTEYQVVVEGTDAAGNQLEEGTLTFTTEKERTPEPAISTSLLAVIVIIVLLAVAGAALAALRAKRRGGGDFNTGRPEGSGQGGRWEDEEGGW